MNAQKDTVANALEAQKDTVARDLGWTAAPGALLAALKQRAALRLTLLASSASSVVDRQGSVYS